nr:RidA family protein [Lentibacter algarum]
MTPIPAATRVGPIITCSITAPYTPGTRDCPEGAEAQVKTVFGHVGEMLEAAGGDFSNVAKMTFYAPDPSAIFAALNSVWVEHFPDPASRPSRHTMKVAEDWGDMLLCADFLAYVEE